MSGSGPPGRGGPAAWLERMAIRDWRAVSALFLTSTLLESLAFGHMEAFTPVFLRSDLGLRPNEVGPWTGLLASATFAVALPLAPFWGALAERYSRKLIIVRSQYIEAVAYALCGLAPDLSWFLVGRILLGFTFGNIAIVIATQSLLTPERRMASAIGLVQAANPIALSLGPPLGALLLPWIGVRGLFLLDAGACLVAAILVTLLMPEPPGRDTRSTVASHMRGAVASVWQRPEVRWNFVAWYLTRGATAVVGTYLPVRIAEMAGADPAPAIGVILGVYGLLTSVGTGLTGRLVDRYGAARLFWPAMIAAAVTVVGAAVAPWLWLLALFAWLRSVPAALTLTVLYAHLAQVLERHERAAIMSFTPVPRNLAAFTFPLLATVAAGLSSANALGVGALAYALAVWVGRQMLSSAATSQATRREASPVETPPGEI